MSNSLSVGCLAVGLGGCSRLVIVDAPPRAAWGAFRTIQRAPRRRDERGLCAPLRGCRGAGEEHSMIGTERATAASA